MTSESSGIEDATGPLQPARLRLPKVWVFQAAQGVVARDWVAQRTGWK